MQIPQISASVLRRIPAQSNVYLNFDIVTMVANNCKNSIFVLFS